MFQKLLLSHYANYKLAATCICKEAVQIVFWYEVTALYCDQLGESVQKCNKMHKNYLLNVCGSM